MGNHQLWSDRHCLMRAAMLSVAEDSRFKFFGPPWLLLWCALTVKMQRGTLGHGLEVNDPVLSFAMSSRLFRPGGPNLNFYLQVTGLELLSSSNHCPPPSPTYCNRTAGCLWTASTAPEWQLPCDPMRNTAPVAHALKSLLLATYRSWNPLK